MIGLFEIPTPTPIPSQVISEGLKAISDSQKLIEAAGNLTALGILALAVVLGILWVVLGRNRGREAQTLINVLQEQSKATTDTLQKLMERLEKRLDNAEDDADKVREQLKTKEEDYRLENFNRDGRLIEALSAFTDANHRIADNGEIANKLLGGINERDAAHVSDLKQIKSDLAIMTSQGSLPVQRLKQLVEKIDTEGTRPLIALQASVDAMAQLVSEIHAQVMPPGQIITVLTQIRSELQYLNEALQMKIAEAVEVKRKTGQIPQITTEGGAI